MMEVMRRRWKVLLLGQRKEGVVLKDSKGIVKAANNNNDDGGVRGCVWCSIKLGICHEQKNIVLVVASSSKVLWGGGR